MLKNTVQLMRSFILSVISVAILLCVSVGAYASFSKALEFYQDKNYEEAFKWQKKALSKASSMDWDIPIMHQRLAAYVSKKSWVGIYHVPVVAAVSTPLSAAFMF